MEEMDQELLAEFLVESNENLGDIEQRLLGLEDNPGDMESINGIFRAIHTVKGTCGFLGLARLEALSHAAENLLGKIRSGTFSITPDLISLLLEAVDGIKAILDGIESTGAEPEIDHASLINRLKAATRAVEDMAGAGIAAETAEPEAGAAGTPEPEPAESTGTEKEKTGESAPETPETPPDPPPKQEAGERKQPAASARAADTTIRVDVDVVDELMNQIGELVLTRNRLMQLMSSGMAPEMQRVGHYIDHTTTTLQQQVLRLRMQPVAGLWNRIPRVVRDLARDLEKKIRVEMEGQETELDRFILAALRDPMTHIIRNSCDHGIEGPEERHAAGKPEEGLIRLTARQESGNIIIEIVDDGKGIDAAAVREKALAMGVITQETAAGMSDHAVLQLIFHPGLSTARKVSKVSGRGVGMDVVRSEIEKAGGSVEIESRYGHGATVRMRIPLTLAIIPALVATAGGYRFAVPQMNVQELIRATGKSPEWEEYAGSHFYRLRDKLLPVMFLSELLHLSTGDREEFTIIVLNVGAMHFGLAMDDIAGAEEVVVKPLGEHLQGLDVYAGCSILGDGNVALILDCNGLLSLANLADNAGGVAEVQDEGRERAKRNLQHIVLFEQSGGRYAIPMSLVQRLESLPSTSVEISAGREVLQYRDRVIPFRRWGHLVAADSSASGEYEMACVILSDGMHHLCLEVEKILDVAEVPLEIELDSGQSLFLGTAVIHGQATEVVDVYELAKTVAPEWFGAREHAGNGKSDTERPGLLLAEDSVFLRELMMPMLESMGYQVWPAEDALQAREMLDKQQPRAMLVDLDMKDRQAMELVRWMKKHERFGDTPVIALASFEPKRGEDAALFADSILKTETASLRERLKRTFATEAEESAQPA